jgi:opacity protein-like surface antigen
MRKFKALVIACIGSAALGAAAHAADMPKGPPLPPLPPIFYDPGSGWYLRGDLGYRFQTIDRAEQATGFIRPTDNTLDGAMAFGFGAGFKVGSVRADLTYDYATPARYRGTAVSSGDVSAKVQASTVLMNFYADFGPWGRFMPYIGGGLGWAHLRVSDYSSTVVPPFGSVPEKTRWNFAFSAVIGTSYAFSRNLLLDAGYRYLNFGSAETAADVGGRTLALKNMAAHEIRFGVRWMFPDPRPISLQ